ncbi:MAG: hypothetical protein MI861_01540, partial [Pirellulales bacterium]|nr:hypothetical protein [Pirellulales bacterium]
MNIPRIVSLTSIDDPRLAPYANLRHADAQRDGSHFIAEGRLTVSRLIDSPYSVQSLLVTPRYQQEFL